MSMEMWSQLNKFQDGDDLDAKTLNVPIGQLGDRTEYLYSKIRQMIGDGPSSSVVLTGVGLSSGDDEPNVGNAVYLDQSSGKFSKAKADMPLYDDFMAKASSFTIGILQSKNNGTGSVVIYGRINFGRGGASISQSDIIESGEKFRPGRYYLSAKEAGKLTATPSGPVVYVCTINGTFFQSEDADAYAIVTPQFLDIGTSHVHRCAALVSRPAGDLSEDGTSVLGYGTEAAGPFHLTFGGTWTGDPRGVAYKFSLVTIETSPRTYRLEWWEGSEISSGGDAPHRSDDFSAGERVLLSNGLTAVLTVDDDADAESSSSSSSSSGDDKSWAAMLFPFAGRGWVNHVLSEDECEDAAPKYDYVTGLDPYLCNYWPPVPPESAALLVNGVEMDNKAIFPGHPTVSFGHDCIHWWTDQDGRKPWPESVRHNGDVVDPSQEKTMVLHWVRGFQGATGPVTSIQPREGAPIKIYGYGSSTPANTGDLEIDAAVDFETQDDGLPGFLVPKSSGKGKLLTGPVVEKIIGGAGVKVISKAGCPKGQGTVVVALDDGTYGSQFTDIALENAEQAKIGMFPYIRLKGYTGNAISSPSAFTATVRVPTSLPDGNYAMRVMASVFGEQGFNDGPRMSACVKFSYNILPDFSAPSSMKYRNLKTSLLKPDSERTVLIPFGHQEDSGIVYNGFDPVMVTTEDPDLESAYDIVEEVLGKSIPSAADFSLQTGVVPDLRPGYLVGIRFSRAVTQAYGVEPYKWPIGFVNLSWSIVSADDLSAES